jgi:hypothetical protein
METDQRVAENLAWCARGIEELNTALVVAIDELTASADNPSAEEICQAHILGALVSVIRTPADAAQLNEPDIQDRLVETAYQLARKMTLRNIASFKDNGA